MNLFVFSIGLFILVLLIVLVHYFSMFGFLHKMWHKGWKVPKEVFEPKTAVILTLRGSDPFLVQCIHGLLTQNFLNYTVFFVFDNLSDPAHSEVEKIVQNCTDRSSGCSIQTLIADEFPGTCSLRCNSAAYAISRLDESFEIVAILDADAIPSPNWLRQLIEPLSDSRFTACSGIRWYVPQNNNFASLVRMLWNIAAVNQMVFCEMPWGGSLAIRREAIFRDGWLERWRQRFADDVPTYKEVCRLKSHVMVTPSLLMLNRETCSFASFYPWVKRQLLIAKLYHPQWKMVVGQAFFLFSLPTVSFALTIYGLCLKNWTLFYWNIASFLLYVIGVFGAFVIMDGSVRRYLRKTGENIPRQTVGGLVKTSVSIILTQFVYAMAICGVFRMKKVSWRGITYQIGPGDRVQMEKFVPYAEIVKATKATQENDSIESL